MKTILIAAATAFVALLWTNAAFATSSDDLGPSTVQQTTSNFEARVSDGASEKSFEFEWCPDTAVTTAVSGKQYPAAGAAGAGAKALYCQNRSSATIYLTLDAVSLTTTGSTGYKFGPGDPLSINGSSTTFGPKMRAAATAKTTTGACLWCAWLK